MAATADARPVRRRGNPNWVKGHNTHRRQPELKRRLTQVVHAHLEKHLPEMLDTWMRRAMETALAELELRTQDPANTGREQA